MEEASLSMLRAMMSSLISTRTRFGSVVDITFPDNCSGMIVNVKISCLSGRCILSSTPLLLNWIAEGKARRDRNCHRESNVEEFMN
jgi:hypothetical protein